MSEIPTSPEEKEAGIPRAKEVWLVDDDDRNSELVEQTIKQTLDDAGYSFLYFETGHEALTEIETRKETGNGQPAVLILDGNLARDPQGSKNGYEVTEKIRSMKDIVQPDILAYSSDREQNEKMLAAGATKILAKMTGAKKMRRMISESISD